MRFISGTGGPMKKLLILSDSHRNIQNMVEAVEIEKPDMIIHLGDHYRDAMQLAARRRSAGTAILTGKPRKK